MGVLAGDRRWLPEYVKSWGSKSLRRQVPSLRLAVDFTSLDSLAVGVWELGW